MAFVTEGGKGNADSKKYIFRVARSIFVKLVFCSLDIMGQPGDIIVRMEKTSLAKRSKQKRRSEVPSFEFSQGTNSHIIRSFLFFERGELFDSAVGSKRGEQGCCRRGILGGLRVSPNTLKVIVNRSLLVINLQVCMH